MAWEHYRLLFRLRSPLHVGYRKVGNLMQTRPYVPGKVLWAALTARLTRDCHDGSQGSEYRRIGRLVQEHFRFGYLWPSLDGKAPYFPWAHDDFDYFLLDSYASTALDYGRGGALDGSLHEVEFIMSDTRPADSNDESHPVYLMGVLFVQAGTAVPWREAVARLQLGGERGYGWGWVEQARSPAPAGDLLGYGLGLSGAEPTVTVPAEKPLLAHTVIQGVEAQGEIEPLVGREWGDGDEGQGAGQRVVFTSLCYAPGTLVSQETTFRIGPYGIWEAVANDP